MIRICKIVEGSQVYRIYPHGCAANTKGWHDPRDRRGKRKAKPEKAQWEKDGFDAGEIETSFWTRRIEGL